MLEEEELKEDKNKVTKAEILTNPLKKLYKYHNNEIYNISLNYNGNLLATCGGDRQIKLFDILNFKNGVTIPSNSAESVFISVSLDYGG